MLLYHWIKTINIMRTKFETILLTIHYITNVTRNGMTFMTCIILKKFFLQIVDSVTG